MRKSTSWSLWIFVALVCVGAAPSAARAQDNAPDAWPRRVLITNDNGINDPKIHALALAMSRVAETYVAASTEDQSGTGSSLSIFRNGSLDVQSVEVEGAAGAWAVDGYPADCVVWALLGPLRDHPPDLVISGVNGGPNLGGEWFGSGTVGAARVAAFLGLPAIAVSGLDDLNPVAVESTMHWVVELAQTELAVSLGAGRYLTVSIPPVEQIKGVRVAARDRSLPDVQIAAGAPDDDGRTTWRITGMTPGAPEPERDIALYLDGWVVVIPMNAHESELDAVRRLQRSGNAIPDWPTP